jgi:hypothetical protein
MFRFTRTAKRSPIKDIQAFPFVPTAYLQMSGVQGGANKMIERLCYVDFMIEEFTIIERHNLPSTYQQGQFVAFIPSILLQDITAFGQWVYLSHDEMLAVVKGHVPFSLQEKAMLKL